MNILRPGFLFTAGEFNNHIVYSFLDIGDGEPAPIKTYSTEKKDKLVTFNPRSEHLNLSPVDEFQNLASINDIKIEDLIGEGSP
jgi:Mono-functional DNA-alkylating methyl methanesulfonate N-term